MYLPVRKQGVNKIPKARKIPTDLVGSQLVFVVLFFPADLVGSQFVFCVLCNVLYFPVIVSSQRQRQLVTRCFRSYNKGCSCFLPFVSHDAPPPAYSAFLGAAAAAAAGAPAPAAALPFLAEAGRCDRRIALARRRAA